jgi:hypothetical protein
MHGGETGCRRQGHMMMEADQDKSQKRENGNLRGQDIGRVETRKYEERR